MSTGNATTDICQACRREPVEAVVVDHDPEQPYRLCPACESRLMLHALRPVEWFNLAALHGPDKHLLHDDFYYDNGIAGQPEEDVEEPEMYPAPTLSQVEGDLERLIDYAMTRYFLEKEVVAALARYPKEQVLSALRRRVKTAPSVANLAVESMAYEVCSLVLGAEAEDWIRERWESYRPEVLQPLAQASARCLPFEEGFQRVTEKLENRLLVAGLDEDCSVLRDFHSPETLQWIEAQEGWLQTRQESSRIDRWGEIAAHSRFSWPKVAQWLKRGRPLSRVALAGLLACQRHESQPQRETPVLENPAPLDVMVAALETYKDTDPFPHVGKRVQQIQQAWRTEHLP